MKFPLIRPSRLGGGLQPDWCVSGSLASGLGVINESLASAREMPAEQ